MFASLLGCRLPTVLVLFQIISWSPIYGALTTLPRARNVQTTVLMFDDHLGDVGGVFRIKEYIDQNRGSVRVDVTDVTDLDASKAERMSYFRLEQYSANNSELVCYSHKVQSCGEATTASWSLKDYSQLLANLYATDEKVLETGPTQADSSLVGPSALLQIVHDNADKFVYDSMGFDEIHLTNTYYFSMLPFDYGLEDEAKLIVVAKKDHININAHNDKDNMAEFNAKLRVKQTKLSELNMLGHLSGIALVSDTKRHTSSEYLSKPSAQLIDFALLRPPRLAALVNFHLVEARSHNRHMGATDVNPILLPAGLGCGEAASGHRPLFVLARQFSGHFSALDHSTDYFVAYDQATNHFRYDTLGRHKMIFALDEQLALLIKLERGDGGAESRLNVSVKNHSDGLADNQNRPHENSNHCAQMSLADESSFQNQLVGVSSLSDLLGLGGNRAGLMYLGYDYQSSCHVYEREVLVSQIPLLSRLHLRLQPAATAKFTLVFYFIDELDSLTANNPFTRQAHAYQSMWLKRLDLVSLMRFSRYTLTNSRLDFTRSSWTLGQVSETSYERRYELLHPTRMFDTLECWPARAQTQLDFVLERAETIGRPTASEMQHRQNQNWVTLTETLEEAVMQFLLQQINFPRSEVCDFELVLPESEDDESWPEDCSARPVADRNSQDRAGLPETMLVRTKLVRPLDYSYRKFLVGWLKSIEPVLRLTRRAQVSSHKQLMNVHECLLSLAATLDGPNKFYMLSCPRIGCALLEGDNPLKETPAEAGTTNGSATGTEQGDDDDDKLDYVPAFDASAKKQHEAPSVDSFPEMCEIYLVSRQVSVRGLVNERFRGQIIREKLEHSKMVLEALELTDASEFATQLHQAIVGEVSLTSALDLNLHDEQLLRGVCYTLDTEFRVSTETKMGPGESGEKKLEVKLVELHFDSHHSRGHCRKACLMNEFCQTYSYSSQRRVCHLSSASRALIQNSTLLMTVPEDQAPSTPTDCTIHALNHLALYRRRPLVIYDSLKHLVEDGNMKLLLSCSLDQCANLCRRNELRRTTGGREGDRELSRSGGCQWFGYIRKHTLCVVEREFELIEELAGSQFDVKKLNATLPDDDMEPREQYRRDFLQDYAVKYRTAIVMEQPVASEGKLGEVVGRVHQRPGLTRILNLDEFECSRECSILSRDCVAFDHCSRNEMHRYQQVCRLYSVRSPLTVPRVSTPPKTLAVEGEATDWVSLPESSPFENQLTELEMKFYAANRSSEHKIGLDVEQSCKHFYLEADNLYLKRALNVARANYQEDGKLVESQFTADDTPPAANWRLDGDDRVKSMLIQALAGVLTGFMLFQVHPTLVQLVKQSQLIERLRTGTLLDRAPVKGRERSMSQVEITEMMELPEDDAPEDGRQRDSSTTSRAKNN